MVSTLLVDPDEPTGKGGSLVLKSAQAPTRAAVELAKDWRTDRILRRLEALLIIADVSDLLVISGAGDVIEPDDGVIAIGSGGNYALAAARVLVKHTQLDARVIAEEAMRVAAGICVYTNEHLTFEELP